LGIAVGQLAWWFKSRGSITAVRNLQVCMPELDEKAVRKLAASSMRNWGQTLFETPVVWHRGAGALDYIDQIKGLDDLEAAIERGKGVIFVSPHLGNWELMGLWAGSKGPLTSLYQPPRRYNVDELLQAVRSKTGATLVPTNARGIAQLIKALKRGEFAGILPDMEPRPKGGVYAPFFGQSALTMTLIHSLVQRSGAAVILCFAQRIPGGFNLVMMPSGEDIASEDAEASTAEMNRTIEKLVRLSPEQYQWEYKRFKRRPEGEPPIYG
jgi:KDO2-lipid IV(A) lauroyltransferase